MVDIKITVEETVTNLDGSKETRTCVLDTPNADSIEKMSDIFRTILYWMTYTPYTIDCLMKDRETIEMERDEKFNM